MRLSSFPRIPLAQTPTAIEPLVRLPTVFGLKPIPAIWIKRDDCTGLGLVGNKLRKLEYLLADALRFGATAVVTGGVEQLNHIRQTAAASAKMKSWRAALLHSLRRIIMARVARICSCRGRIIATEPQSGPVF
jgi:1-aminocyclopropane-1-carboxylate deaminase/D-cysteine desulfhydrase-like pyridoxal-dependent ACC family enzyme